MPRAKALFSLLAAMLIIFMFMWMFRFDVEPVGNGLPTAIVTDRWTGVVSVCFPYDTCDPIYPAKT